MNFVFNNILLTIMSSGLVNPRISKFSRLKHVQPGFHQNAGNIYFITQNVLGVLTLAISWECFYFTLEKTVYVSMEFEFASYFPSKLEIIFSLLLISIAFLYAICSNWFLRFCIIFLFCSFVTISVYEFVIYLVYGWEWIFIWYSYLSSNTENSQLLSYS